MLSYFSFTYSPRIKTIITAGATSFLVGILVSANWTPPGDAPPTCPLSNPACNPPIHSGDQGQNKEGPLTLGAFGGPSGLRVLNGNVGIGTMSPGTDHSAPASVALDVAIKQITGVRVPKRITGVQDPVDDDDAVNLGYLNAQSGGGSGLKIVKVSAFWSSSCVPSPYYICKGNGEVTLTATCPADSFIIKCGFAGTTLLDSTDVRDQAAEAFAGMLAGKNCPYNALGAQSFSRDGGSVAIVA